MRNNKKQNNSQESLDETQFNGRIINLAIKLNFNTESEPCPLCDKNTNPNIGAELTLAENSLVVCRDCGNTYAPLLAALLDLSEMATHFYFAQEEFGNNWQENFYQCHS